MALPDASFYRLIAVLGLSPGPASEPSKTATLFIVVRPELATNLLEVTVFVTSSLLELSPVSCPPAVYFSALKSCSVLTKLYLDSYPFF